MLHLGCEIGTNPFCRILYAVHVQYDTVNFAIIKYPMIHEGFIFLTSVIDTIHFDWLRYFGSVHAQSGNS
jgi:hypothetical protein